MTNKINLYVDGPQLNEIQKNYGIEIDDILSTFV